MTKAKRIVIAFSFVFLFVVLNFADVFTQTSAKISDIRGRWGIDDEIRVAFRAIATDTKTVTGAWTFDNTLTLGEGATLTNPHADTLKFTESVVQINGGLAIGSAPDMTITAIDTSGAGRWVKITVAGVVFWAVADTSVIK